jgi:hypothetical protein
MLDCLLCGCVGGVLATCVVAARGQRALAHVLTGMTAIAYAALALYYALHGDVIGASACGAIAAIWARSWWRGPRKRRKRSLKALGHKARARLAAMARSMPRPGPVLRPVPQGARA